MAAEADGKEPEIDPAAQAELTRLIAMLEIGFLAAAADGELADAELSNLAENFCAWLQMDLSDEALTATFQMFADGIDEEGFEARLANAAGALDDGARDAAFALACVISAADGAVEDDELGALGDIAAALGIAEEEAESRFNDILDQMEAAGG